MSQIFEIKVEKGDVEYTLTDYYIASLLRDDFSKIKRVIPNVEVKEVGMTNDKMFKV